MSNEPTCSRCHLPIHPSDAMRHMGRHVAHESARCIELLKHKADAAAALAISAESKLEAYAAQYNELLASGSSAVKALQDRLDYALRLLRSSDGPTGYRENVNAFLRGDELRCYRCHTQYATPPLRCVCGGTVFEPVVEKPAQISDPQFYPTERDPFDWKPSE